MGCKMPAPSRRPVNVRKHSTGRQALTTTDVHTTLASSSLASTSHPKQEHHKKINSSPPLIVSVLTCLQIIRITRAEFRKSFNPFCSAAASFHILLVDSSLFDDGCTPLLFTLPLNTMISFLIYPPLPCFFYFSPNATYGSIL